jgi:hypothetical protein
MINKLVGTRHTSLKREIQFRQTPLRDSMQFGHFFFFDMQFGFRHFFNILNMTHE